MYYARSFFGLLMNKKPIQIMKHIHVLHTSLFLPAYMYNEKMHFECILWTNEGHYLTFCYWSTSKIMLTSIRNCCLIKSCINSPYLLSLLFGLAGEGIGRLSVGGGGRDWGPVYPLGSRWGTGGAFQKPIIWIRTTSSWYNKKTLDPLSL